MDQRSLGEQLDEGFQDGPVHPKHHQPLPCRQEVLHPGLDGRDLPLGCDPLEPSQTGEAQSPGGP